MWEVLRDLPSDAVGLQKPRAAPPLLSQSQPVWLVLVERVLYPLQLVQPHLRDGEPA